MRPLLACLVLVATLVPASGLAQTPSASATPAPPAESDTDFGVSLERIRRRLEVVESTPLQGLDRRATFRIEIIERAQLDDILKRMDFRKEPVPAGGLYAYEQQRRLFSPTSRPLMQPYAAFSGGELITIAIQNLLGRYVAREALERLDASSRARAAREARRDVDRSIEEYCAQQPNRWEVLLCNPVQ